jgi:hypothetical protein
MLKAICVPMFHMVLNHEWTCAVICEVIWYFILHADHIISSLVHSEVSSPVSHVRKSVFLPGRLVHI